MNYTTNLLVKNYFEIEVRSIYSTFKKQCIET